MIKLLFVLLFLLINVGHLPTAHASQMKLTTAWLGEHETFIVWYAKKNGWDKEFNLDLEILEFNSGKEIIEGKRAYKWKIAGLGAVPALLSTLSNEVEIIAIANDESASNIIYAPTNSKVFQAKGYNPAYPDIFGSPKTLDKALILTTKGTSAHYMLTSWLQSLGLTSENVKIQFMTPRAIIGAMKNNYGDIYSVWSPYTFMTEDLGLKPVAFSKDISISQPIVLVADAKFAKQNPQKIQNFLKLYIKGIEMIRNTTPDKLAVKYIQFYEEWTGVTLTTEEAMLDIRNHPVFTLEEQIKIFSQEAGKSTIHKWLMNIVEYYDINGDLSAEEKTRLLALDNLNDEYLNSIQ